MILLLWLEGPLQSWGVDSKFDRKTTLYFPTRSALSGLICSAMGRKGQQTEFLGELRKTKISLIGLRKISNFIHSVSEENWMMEDYHTIGNGYDETDPWQDLCVPRKLDGTKANNVHSRITHRFYLVDFAFAVLWEMEESLAKECAEALAVPVYDLYLGRKSCIPSEFIFQGLFPYEDQARTKVNDLGRDKALNVVFEVREVDYPTEYELWDVPINFGKFKKYDCRFVEVHWA